MDVAGPGRIKQEQILCGMYHNSASFYYIAQQQAAQNNNLKVESKTKKINFAKAFEKKWETEIYICDSVIIVRVEHLENECDIKKIITGSPVA